MHLLPHGSAELLISHAAVLLLLPPELSNSLGLQELEDAISAVLPFHQTLVLLRVNQNVPDELPKVGSSWSCNGARIWFSMDDHYLLDLEHEVPLS